MLEIKNLKKIYKTKGGQEVRALDDVSVKFPETGMVFLLGKSGSGKSTLLNVTGGLDKPDSGEIIIKGKNSKNFSGSDFDSYRNTYIGFIFQEYNILNEFNIEQNIELALQLQGKKNDKEAVEKLLDQVDLKGLGKRKPNTLSGGQKQRVAIARALIKNPEIIMADEPTGALDSNTGKQVFDTLKKLSEEKLVIIVSHDRDFAEIYADRIIELADGKIISDMSKDHIEPKQINENINIVNENVLSIKNVEELKRDDLDKIYDLLKDKNGEVIISTNDKNVKAIKQAIHIGDDNKSEVFNDTKEIETKEYDPKNTKFIKSRLPYSRAFKIGASSLKSKPIRMLFTIFLTIVALVMFGVTSTLMLYDESYSVTQALKNSTNDYEQISKSFKYKDISHNLNIETGEDKTTSSRTSYQSTFFAKSDIDQLNSKSNNKYAGVIKFRLETYYSNTQVLLKFYEYTVNNSSYFPIKGITGFIDAGEEYLNSNGFSISGTYPTKATEIAISDYMYQMMQKSSPETIKSYSDVIGKTYKTYFGNNSMDKQFKITGIINTGTIPQKFDELKNNNTTLNQKELQELKDSFEDYIGNSFHLMGYVSDNFASTYSDQYQFNNYNYLSTIGINGIVFGNTTDVYSYNISDEYYNNYLSPKIVEKNINNLKFYDANGNTITYKNPGKNEVYLSKDEYDNATNKSIDSKVYLLREMIENSHITKDLYNEVYNNKNDYYELVNYANQYPDAVIELYDRFAPKYLKVMNIYDYANYYYNQIQREPNYGSSTELQSKYQSVYELVNNIDEEINSRTYNYDTYIESLDTIFKNDSYINDYLLVISAEDYSENSEIKNILNDYYNGLEINYEVLKKLLDDNNYKYRTYDLNYNKAENMYGGLNVGYYYKTSSGKYGELTIIGYYDGISNNTPILNDDFMKENATINSYNFYYSETQTDYIVLENAIYTTLIVKTNFSQSDINLMLSSYPTYKYTMTNSTYQTLSVFLNMVNTLKNVFLIIGIVFAVFAALMLFNFISSSISSKTREIGILRAVGARGSDLFKIFFTESGLISIICVIVAAIISFFVCRSLNSNLAKNLNMVLLDFGIINIGLILAGAILIAVIGTFIPVFIASKKQPVESIRTL